MTAPDRYGQRKVPKMIREWDAHRQACRAEGTPAIQATLDAMEEHIDYAYRATPADRIAALTEQLAAARRDAEIAEEELGLQEEEACMMENSYLELKKERDALDGKLTKAVELALKECPFRWGTPRYDKWWQVRRTIIAELTGGKDE